MANWMEQPLALHVGDDELLAVIHGVDAAAALGVLVIVGGPQYRIGSHRQFVLLARRLAAAGYPVMRFDHRGSGDSAGTERDFEQIDDDIRCAIDAFLAQGGIERVVLWGLCDAASAAMMYAASDERVAGLVLANPWVRAPHTEARTRLEKYYAARLRNPDFWRKVLRLDLNLRASARDLWRSVCRLTTRTSPRGEQPERHFIERMLDGWSRFSGPSLIVLSGEDLTADEFRHLCRSNRAWQAALHRDNVEVVELRHADHTFSGAARRADVEQATLDWLTARGRA